MAQFEFNKSLLSIIIIISKNDISLQLTEPFNFPEII